MSSMNKPVLKNGAGVVLPIDSVSKLRSALQIAVLEARAEHILG
jgi:hypothetical protein